MDSKSKIRGLTLIRPWPWPIYALPPGERKDVENRDWDRPPHWVVGQHLAIHSGLRWDQDAWEDIRALGCDIPPQAEHPKAVITCVARVSAIVTAKTSRWRSGTRWAFGLADVVALPEPVHCTGGQGLWLLPNVVLEQVRRQYRLGQRTDKKGR